ncbi:MAG: type III polyketide synthase, partial [Phycisphaerales bacterium]|nr:type III polyketide synthase [Phycisphaerales bacterium]
QRILTTAYRRTGIETRHTLFDGPESETRFPPAILRDDAGPTTGDRMQLYAQHAGALAHDACAMALHHATISPEAITHLISVSCTGFIAPGVDVQLIHALGLPAGTPRTAIGFMGCHGALNGLRIARALVDADPSAVVLMCCVELCSLHFAYGWNPERIVANALFADGAGAVIVAGPDAPVHAPAAAWTIVSDATEILPDTTDPMSWTIGDHGFEMTLSPTVPDRIHNALPSFLTRWLGDDIDIAAINAWAVHPGGPRILDAVEASLELPPAALDISRTILRTCGNVSSVTLLLILHAMTDANVAGPLLMLAFGPGLTIEAAHLTR